MLEPSLYLVKMREASQRKRWPSSTHCGKNAVPSFLRHHISREVRLTNSHLSQFCVPHKTKYVVITNIKGESTEVVRYTEGILFCKEGTGREEVEERSHGFEGQNK